MAKKLPKEDPQELTAAELKKILDQAVEEASKASEHTSEHGNIIRQLIDRFDLDRTAVTFTRRVHRQGTERQLATVRSTIKLWLLAGFFDQVDAFEDIAELLHDKLQSKPGKGKKTPATLHAVN
jgi:hypothetical protein